MWSAYFSVLRCGKGTQFSTVLKLPVDGSQEAYDEIDESQDCERSKTTVLLCIHEVKVECASITIYFPRQPLHRVP